MCFNKKYCTLSLFIVLTALLSCTGGSTSSSSSEGDTLQLKYAKRLCIVQHEGYTEVALADPWNEGKTLHRYILINTADRASRFSREANFANATIIHTPLKRSVVATSVHCGLVHSFGKVSSIAGVCDLRYINLPYIQRGCEQGTIADCGSGLAPSLETILDLQPDALFLSPFQNSGGYGKLEKIGVPIIETADYMEKSALGRAEWMRFYGMLFGAEREADSIFQAVEQRYLQLKALAKAQHDDVSVLMDKQTGAVWYVPGGQSTIGRLIADANIRYPWAANEQSGSVALPFESVLEQAADADCWLFRYNAPRATTLAELLSENNGYSQFRAFQHGEVYGCNTATTTFYEDTPFHPDLLLRDFISITHPELQLGAPVYFEKLRK